MSMIRKTLTILSLIGLTISVLAWGLSYFGPAFRTRHLTIVLTGGGIDLDRYTYKGPIAPLSMWNGFRTFETGWQPRYAKPFQNVGYWRLFIPLWMPTVFFGLAACGCHPPYFYARSRRKKLGLCLQCGYDLRGSETRCPECGRPFEKDELKQNADH
jgi:hypothetical protein